MFKLNNKHWEYKWVNTLTRTAQHCNKCSFVQWSRNNLNESFSKLHKLYLLYIIPTLDFWFKFLHVKLFLCSFPANFSIKWWILNINFFGISIVSIRAFKEPTIYKERWFIKWTFFLSFFFHFNWKHKHI